MKISLNSYSYEAVRQNSEGYRPLALRGRFAMAAAAEGLRSHKTLTLMPIRLLASALRFLPGMRSLHARVKNYDSAYFFKAMRGQMMCAVGVLFPGIAEKKKPAPENKREDNKPGNEENAESSNDHEERTEDLNDKTEEEKQEDMHDVPPSIEKQAVETAENEEENPKSSNDHQESDQDLKDKTEEEKQEDVQVSPSSEEVVDPEAVERAKNEAIAALKAEKKASWEAACEKAKEMIDQCWPEGVDGPIHPWLDEDKVMSCLYGHFGPRAPRFAKNLDIDKLRVEEALKKVQNKETDKATEEEKNELLEALNKKDSKETVDLKTLYEDIAQEKAGSIVDYYQTHSFMTDTKGPLAKYFKKCRGVIQETPLKPGETLELYHGRSLAAAEDIAKNGFDLTFQTGGLEMGSGIYMGDYGVAQGYAKGRHVQKENPRVGAVLKAELSGDARCGVVNMDNLQELSDKFFLAADWSETVKNIENIDQKALLKNEFRRQFFQRLGYDVLTYETRLNYKAIYTVVFKPELLNNIEIV